MGLSTGIDVSVIDYAGAANPQASVQLMIDALPDPDSEPANLALNAFSYLDEIHPMALVELRAHLVALKAAVPAV